MRTYLLLLRNVNDIAATSATGISTSITDATVATDTTAVTPAARLTPRQLFDQSSLYATRRLRGCCFGYSSPYQAFFQQSK